MQDIKKFFHHKKFWAGVLLAQIILFFIFSKIDFLVSLNESFFETQKKFHQQVFSIFPFSVGDFFYLILTGILIYLLIKIFKKKSRSKPILYLLIVLNILYFVYQIFWGMLYFQKPLIKLLPKEMTTIEEVKKLSIKYLEICKNERNRVSEDKNGVFKVSQPEVIIEEILLRQNSLPKEFNKKNGVGIKDFKPGLFRGIMSYTGILGYYNPFTAEAQYNPQLPSTYLPFTLAHESSHQMGYAREEEANFIGYLIGKNSKNRELRYSTNYFVLKSLLNSLVVKDEKFVKNILSQYSEPMKRDRLYEKAFVKKHEGILDVFFGKMNDYFLKSNQQDGSVNYSYFVDLMVRYERNEKE